MGAAMNCLLVSLFVFSAVQAAEGPPFALSGLQIERIRKELAGQNRVTTTFTLQAREEVRDLKASIRYQNASGKTIASAGPVKVGDFRPGERKAVRLSQLLVPAFRCYRIHLTGLLDGAPRKWSFYATSPAEVPIYLPEEPIPRTVQLVYLAHDVTRDVKNGTGVLTVRVRNIGAAEAPNPVIVMELMYKKKSIGSVRQPLVSAGGRKLKRIRGGEEVVAVVRFRRLPRFSNYTLKLDWDKPGPEELLSGGEFSGVKDVELAHFAFKSDGDGDAKSLEVYADARNGLDKVLHKIEVKLTLYRRKDGSEAPQRAGSSTVEIEELSAAQVKPIVFRFGRVGSYSDFDYEVSYQEEEVRKGPERQASIEVQITNAVKRGDGRVELAGVAMNRGEVRVRDLVLEFEFKRGAGGEQQTVKKSEHRVGGVLAPGGSKSFSLSLEDCPEFDEYSYEVRFTPVK